MATTIHFVYPVFTLLGCVLFCHAPLSGVKVLCVALCSAGILMFYTPGQSGNAAGVLLAFLSGITYSFYIIYLDQSGLGNLPSLVLAFWLALFSFVGQALYGVFTGELFVSMTPLGWFCNLVVLMVFSQSASILFQIGVRDCRAAAGRRFFRPLSRLPALRWESPSTPNRSACGTGLGVLAILAGGYHS